MKRAMFFTIDSLLASGIIIAAILLISNFYFAEQQKTNVDYASQDLVRIFSITTIEKIDNDYVKSLIASGLTTNLNNTILEQIGEFWAADQIELARNLTKNLTDDIVPGGYGFSLLINGEPIYSRNAPVKKSLVSSRKIISGIAKAKPTDGFISRVILNGIKSKKTNAYVYFGGYEGDGNLTKILFLPSEVIAINSSYLEVDGGSSFDLYINNQFSGTYVQGSGGGGDMLADKWNISNAYLANFVPGPNMININFTSKIKNYIAGGFLRVKYITSSLNDTQTPGYEKYLFPGIDGVINLYSSIYVPSSPGYMNASLHFFSQYQTYLTVGNVTVFESNSSSSDQIVQLSDSNFSSRLDYSLLNEKTLPIRMGLRNITLLGQADTVLITDRTGSMNACDIVTNCTAGLCDSSPTGGCHDRRDYAAQKSDKQFIKIILNKSNNNVGLVGFGQSLSPYCDFHDLSPDNVSLSYRISNYPNSFCGYTCISCSVLSATELLTEKKSLYGLTETHHTNTTEFTFTSVRINFTEKFPISVNQSKFIKARLTVFGRNVNVESDYKDCIYLNNNYVGRMCDGTSGWHTCSFPLRPGWFTNTSIQNVTLTNGNVSACFGTGGTHDNWMFNNVKLDVWQTKNSISNLTYAVSPTIVTVGDPPFPNVASINLSLNVNKTQIKAATIEFNASGVRPQFYDCVYINGNYVGRVDYQKWNGTNVSQKVLFDVPAVWIKDGTNQINITAGTTSGCLRTSGTNNNWNFSNVNLSVISANESVDYDRFMSMLVMSDGEANTKIGDCAGCDSSGARSETIAKACEAHNLYGISIYTVLFGDVTNANAVNVLNQSACCDDCSHFYLGNNQNDLLEIYSQIAESILRIGFQTQIANITGNLNKTKLYPDSYIEFNYTPSNIIFNKIPIGFESDRFGNNVSNGTLTIYPNTSVLDAKVTSYSENKWTDMLVVNGNIVYNLSEYGRDYLPLGDPFTVNIPTSNINEGNNSIKISTGLTPVNSTNGSSDDRLIYTLLLGGITDYTGVLSKSNGCSWSLSFDDGTSAIIPIPPSYSGSNACIFSSKTFDNDDALQVAAYQLLSNLDIDKDGKLDVNIDATNLDTNSLTISKVPSLWGPAIMEIRIWT